MEAASLQQAFDTGLPYDAYVATGTPAQQDRWRAVYGRAALAPAQRELLGSFTRQLNLLVVSGVWCGDCIEQVPLLQRIVEANPARLAMRLVDRDARADLSGRLRINAGARVPMVLLLAEDFELCSTQGDRPLSRYRMLAAKQIGPACSLGAVVPPEAELAATLQDWLGEVERVQLMLRLSTRLRQKHND